MDTQAAEGGWFGQALSSLFRRAVDPVGAEAHLDAAVERCSGPEVADVLRSPEAPLPAQHLERPYLCRWRWAERKFTAGAGRSTAGN